MTDDNKTQFPKPPTDDSRKDFEAWYVQSRGVDPASGEAMSEETMLGLLKRNHNDGFRYWPDVQELYELWETRFGKGDPVVEVLGEAAKPGLYAIRHVSNWDGEGDVLTTLATFDKDGRWRYDENGAPVLEYKGDRILKAWPLDHVGGQALTYDAGVAAAASTIRALMDEFREEHSDRDPAPGTSGMSKEHLEIWHAMYRLEQAVRELKDGNPVPQPASTTIRMQNMATAPRDGTRILIYGVTFGYCQKARDYVPSGEKWQESWFVDGKFEPWTGSAKSRSVGGHPIEPLGWAPVPEIGDFGPARQPIPVPGRMRYEDVLLVGGPLDGNVRSVMAGVTEIYARAPRPDLGDYDGGDVMTIDLAERLVYRRTAVNTVAFRGVVYVLDGVDIYKAMPELIAHLKTLQAKAYLNSLEDDNG